MHALPTLFTQHLEGRGEQIYEFKASLENEFQGSQGQREALEEEAEKKNH